jgi:hypothetical protein
VGVIIIPPPRPPPGHKCEFEKSENQPHVTFGGASEEEEDDEDEGEDDDTGAVTAIETDCSAVLFLLL